MIDERLQKEADRHDEIFSNNTRASLSKYYSVGDDAYSDYKKLVFLDNSGKRVLELGCGLGCHAIELADHDASQVTGIDISPVAVELSTKSRGKRCNINFFVMDAHNTSFPSCHFDRIYGCGILHHLDLDKACVELSRILDDKGKAIFLEPLGCNPAINIFRRFTKSLRTEDEHPLTNIDFLTLKKYFKIERCQYYCIFSLIAVLFYNYNFFNGINRFLARLDKTVLKIAPWIGRFAWITIFVMKKK